MESTRLDSLLISEVSGVDDPANQLPGWMVTKATGGPDLLLVLAHEMELVTKAADSKKPYGDVEYADSGYQKDGKKRYPLDTEEHIRAAWSYVNQEDNAALYTAEQLASIKAKIKAAMKKIGATVEEAAKKSDSPESIVAKIKGILLGAPTGKEADVEKQEFVDALAENNTVLATALAEAVSKSLAPAKGAEGGAEEETEKATALTEEKVTQVITDAIETHVVKQYNEIFEKVLDRIEGVEKHLGIAARKSLEGQEAEVLDDKGQPVTKAAPDLGAAIAAAFKR